MDDTELMIKVTGYGLMAVRLNSGELWKDFNLEGVRWSYFIVR